MVSAISSGWSAYSENPLPLCNAHTNRIFLTNGKHPSSSRHYLIPTPTTKVKFCNGGETLQRQQPVRSVQIRALWLLQYGGSLS